MFSSYDNAKNNQRMAAERLAMAKAKKDAKDGGGKKGKGGGGGGEGGEGRGNSRGLFFVS